MKRLRLLGLGILVGGASVLALSACGNSSPDVIINSGSPSTSAQGTYTGGSTASGGSSVVIATSSSGFPLISRSSLTVSTSGSVSTSTNTGDGGASTDASTGADAVAEAASGSDGASDATGQ